jgi:hypothetical protein
MTTANRDIVEMTSQERYPEDTINNALNRIDKRDGFIDYTPHASTTPLTLDEETQLHGFVKIGTRSVALDLKIDLTKGFTNPIAFWNNSGQNVTILTTAGGSTGITIATGKIRLVAHNGTNVYPVSAEIDTTGSITIPTTNPNASLTAYWPLDEASGTRADLIGTNTLTDNNTVTQADGKVGKVAQFTRANSEYLSRTDNASLSTGDTSFTFSLWAYFDTKATNFYLLAKDASGARDYYIFYTTGTDRLSFGVFFTDTTSAIATASSFGNVPTATWLHIVGWHDASGDTVNIKVNNGTTDSAATANKTPNDSATEFRIGASAFVGAENYFNGRIGRVRFWKRLLTTQEITDLYLGFM